jgi:hypothetical protein
MPSLLITPSLRPILGGYGITALGLVLVDVGDDKDRTNCLVTFGGVSNST